MRTWNLAVLIGGLVLGAALAGKADTADTTGKAGQTKLDTETQDAIELFKKTDTKIGKLFDSAAGYAVFPSIGKGAIGIGGAYGEGEVFEHGQLVGKATLTQVTIGAQLGGQEYAEAIFFENKAALDDFKDSKLAMSAQVSAVAAAEGASANAKYEQGVLVFTVAKQGLMGEASVGGQKFKFTPLAK
jgi:lipid-binding SYLF domain-containing protein